MPQKFIVANWKSNKTTSQAKEWLAQISNFQFPISNEKEIIICPPFTLLSTVKSYIIDNKLPISLGAQNISPFSEGSYTGEVNGKQIKEFADYVLIGHSERRNYLNEDDKIINKKLQMAIKYGLVPILCISDITQLSTFNSQLSTLLVAFEPLGAIGTGFPDSPEHAKNISAAIKNKINNIQVLYGGSVNPDNIKSFMSIPNLSGVLVGKESLSAREFLKIIINA